MTPTDEPGDPSKAAGDEDDCNAGSSISERITATAREKSTTVGKEKEGERRGESQEGKMKGSENRRHGNGEEKNKNKNIRRMQGKRDENVIKRKTGGGQ